MKSPIKYEEIPGVRKITKKEFNTILEEWGALAMKYVRASHYKQVHQRFLSDASAPCWFDKKLTEKCGFSKAFTHYHFLHKQCGNRRAVQFGITDTECVICISKKYYYAKHKVGECPFKHHPKEKGEEKS